MKRSVNSLKKVSIVSLGCSKNLVDSEQMLGLINGKFEFVENEADADVMIVNTCSFIESAKQESIDCILSLAEEKKNDKNKKLIVTGCLAQRYKEEILKELPEVDAVVGVNDFDKIADIIDSLENNNNIAVCGDTYMDWASLARIRTTPEYTAFLKIAEGCDNCCTYCVIPSIRGRYRSRREEDIIAEAEKMAAEGVRELIIIAQDTTRYGFDLYREYTLPRLLKKLCKIDGIEWIRLHYCYPELVTDELTDVIAEEPKICSYMDIPIQHCNDEILKKMGRRTDKAQIVSVINKLREKIPDVVIRTSLIAGFPGETEKQIDELEQFVRDMKFDRLGVFAYSQEENTPAAKLPDQIDEQVKIDRQEQIMFAQLDVSEELCQKKIGTVQRVLVEGYDSFVKMYYGRTYADSVEVDGKVFFKAASPPEIGGFADVLINESDEYDLFGERCDSK